MYSQKWRFVPCDRAMLAAPPGRPRTHSARTEPPGRSCPNDGMSSPTSGSCCDSSHTSSSHRADGAPPGSMRPATNATSSSFGKVPIVCSGTRNSCHSPTAVPAQSGVSHQPAPRESSRPWRTAMHSDPSHCCSEPFAVDGHDDVRHHVGITSEKVMDAGSDVFGNSSGSAARNSTPCAAPLSVRAIERPHAARRPSRSCPASLRASSGSKSAPRSGRSCQWLSTLSS
mmetsp:Transcript_62252/g.185245  ORF Transcript_62252/g.185245 Transcript_62252/m.185245 type:complete len:228 (-) Transcript_62252:184-867(-)